MRKLTLITLLIALALLAACNSAKPQIAAETTNIDLGDVPNGEVITRQIAIRNDGEATLNVQSLSTSCGCTTATLDAMQIEPGQSANLHITFDSGAHGPDLTGPLLRHVYVNSDDPTQPELIVELAANITPPQIGSN